ncbi:hypothetical protein CHS0354_000453 [Potamilus streckersoni]|uniref:Phosphoglucosamine mutase n=1 Tax=Potamilus streckersoni TaxID=2493646 RepID=A0AAE0T7N7_9BIVA|nr:hypothetical protein CHS0354_000453 [Potamilus streckersoni]
MSLMVSVSGLRGIVGESLTPNVLLKYSTAFALHLKSKSISPKIVIGRDSRPTGKTIQAFIQATFQQLGCNIVDIGIVPTPTVALAIQNECADGGIVVTASHNPIQWNALKFLNHLGEFVTPEESQNIYSIAENTTHTLQSSNSWHAFGMCVQIQTYLDFHIQKILHLPLIHSNIIKSQHLSVLIDAVNGAGSEIIPMLCEQLGVHSIVRIACNPHKIFPRNPEPIEENLIETSSLVKHYGVDLGIVVDPDADRVCFICEDGSLFGEEYSLVACADFVLSKKAGAVVNNLSSSRALLDVATKHHSTVYSSKVGEANVVALMKKTHAVIGGEGSGGIILPELHYGRDAMVGTALFLQAFAEWRIASKNTTPNTIPSLSLFKKTFPEYHIAKAKTHLSPNTDIKSQLEKIKQTCYGMDIIETDGLKIYFDSGWVHLRSSNTEPIIRIYAEGKTKTEAERIVHEFEKKLSL